MHMVRAFFGAALLAFAVQTGAALADPTFPPLTGRVVDNAGILSDSAKDHLTAMSTALEAKTHGQLVVVTLPSLQGHTIEDYGYQLGRHWGIGQKKTDNGALLIVAPKEHKVRIEVGYGLEGTLTDAQSALIITNVITPAFKRGDYDGGVLAGAATILQVLGVTTDDVNQILSQQQPQSQPQDNSDGGGGIPIIVILIILWLVFGRFFWPLLFLGGFGRGGWGGGGFGGGSSGGGFSGGGGSFGGGGASGSW